MPKGAQRLRRGILSTDKDNPLSEIPLILNVLSSRAEVIRFPEVFGASALSPPRSRTVSFVKNSRRNRLDRISQVRALSRRAQHDVNVIALGGHRVKWPIVARTEIGNRGFDKSPLLERQAHRAEFHSAACFLFPRRIRGRKRLTIVIVIAIDVRFGRSVKASAISSKGDVIALWEDHGD